MESLPRLTDEIKVSTEAAQQLAAITEQEQDSIGVRLFISSGGCSGMNYGMTMVQNAADGDSILEQDGLKLFVDEQALSMLKGVEIDFVNDERGPSFVFKNLQNPNQGGGGCGTCGSSSGCGSAQ